MTNLESRLYALERSTNLVGYRLGQQESLVRQLAQQYAQLWSIVDATTSCSTTQTFYIRDINNNVPISGATVTISDGTNDLWTGTTDSMGKVKFTVSTYIAGNNGTGDYFILYADISAPNYNRNYPYQFDGYCGASGSWTAYLQGFAVKADFTLFGMNNNPISGETVSLWWGADQQGSGSITKVQNNQVSTTGSTATSSLSGTTSGNVLIALLTTRTSGTPTTTPGGWTLIDSNTSSNGLPLYAYYKVATGSDSFSVSLAGSTRYILFMAEYSGVSRVSPLDQHSTGTSSTGTTPSGTITTTQNLEVAVAGWSDGDADTYSSVSGGFTLVDQATNGVATGAAWAQRVLSSTATVSSNATTDNALGGNGLIFSLIGIAPIDSGTTDSNGRVTLSCADPSKGYANYYIKCFSNSDRVCTYWGKFFLGSVNGYTSGSKAIVVSGTFDPFGGLEITNPGSHYPSNGVTVSVSGGGGSGAAPQVTVIDGYIKANGSGGSAGTGYTSAPTVTISPPPGSGATATANLLYRVGSVTINTPGSGYKNPTIAFSGGGTPTTVASASAYLNQSGGAWYITMNNQGAGYTSTPTITVTDTVGSGMTLTAVMDGYVDSCSIGSNGAGYANSCNPVVVFSGGGGSGASAQTSLSLISGSSYQVSGISMTSKGTGYTSAPTVTITTGSGATGTTRIKRSYLDVFSSGTYGSSSAAATATAVLSASVVDIKILNEGNSFTSAPTIGFTGGGGSGAAATCTIDADTGRIDSVTLTSGGSGYTSAPSVTFSGGGGTAASAAAIISGTVTSVTMNTNGSGYYQTPTPIFYGGGCTSVASGSCTMNGSNGVASVSVSNGGSGYTSAPTVYFATDCAYPCSRILQITDSTTGVSSQWTDANSSISGVTYSFGGCGSCLAASGVNVGYTAYPPWLLGVSWSCVGISNSCPATYPSSFSASTNGVATTLTCPGSTTSSAYSATLVTPSTDDLHCGSATLSVSE